MIQLLRRAAFQTRLVASEALTISQGPWPVAKMVRNGLAIGAGFCGLMLAGKTEGALICAFFTNLLMFVDQPGPLKARFIVLALASGASALGGLLGALCAPTDLAVFAGTFAFALLAGVIHGSVRGIESIPRNAAICFVAGAYLPVVDENAGLAIGVGTACALSAIVFDDLLQPRARTEPTLEFGLLLKYPGPRFSLAYGLAAVCGLAIGQYRGDARPYWLTITTLLVMQPDHRANMHRAIHRFLGTMAGVLAAFAIVSVLPEAHRLPVIVGCGLSMPFVWPLAYARNYGLGVAVLSTWILTLLDLALPPNEAIGMILAARLTDTSIGCGLALAGSLVFAETSKERF